MKLLYNSRMRVVSQGPRHRIIRCAAEDSKPVRPTHASSRAIPHIVTAADNVQFAVRDTNSQLNLDDVLEVPHLRDKLLPQPSPFVVHNNYGGGFISDLDRVALQALQCADSASSGAVCLEVDAKDLYPEMEKASVNLKGNPEAYEVQIGSMDQVCVPLPPWAVRAGARETIYFEPSEVTAAIVTCGGLCPGLNDVVLGLVRKLEDYGVKEGNILGIRYGFRGFYDPRDKPITLNSKALEGIHLKGGTVLGTSRGGADIKQIVKKIDMWGVNMVFVVGGNGGNAGASAIQQECLEQGVQCSIVGVPKSIDNDILLIDKCFGFDTAVEEAQRALMAAKIEASSARSGVGLVKLMGRQSGFIAMQASTASGVVDACLIPEVPFRIEGANGLMAYLKKVIELKGHCVLCVAEGAGQDILSDGSEGKDASGNPILKDVGVWMKKELKTHIPEADIKYIDPTYMIRAIPTTSTDRIYCKVLAHQAVHAAFAGYTGACVGLVNTHYTILPISVIVQAPRRVNPRSSSYNRLMHSIGQPKLY